LSGGNDRDSAGNNQPGKNNQAIREGQTSIGNKEAANGNKESITAGQLTTNDKGTNPPSTLPSPSATLTPSVSAGYPTLTTATPTASAGSGTASNSSSASASPSFLSWKSRSKATLQWASANRLATVLGALILLSLILYLASAFRRRQKLTSAKRVNMPKVQPKVQPNDSSAADFDEPVTAGPVKSRASSSLPNEFVKKPAVTPAATVATPQNHSWLLTKPSLVSPSAGREHRSDEEEREVFEL